MASLQIPKLGRRSSNRYTVVWLCALPKIELPPAIMMLDNHHEPPAITNASDDNQYFCGDLYGHNVVIAWMPEGRPGELTAQKLVVPLQRSFPNLRICLFVGIGGGVPCHPQPLNPREDVRLGDVIVGWPEETEAPAIIHYDHAWKFDEYDQKLMGFVQPPNDTLVKALTPLELPQLLGRKVNFDVHLERLKGISGFEHPGIETDVLFKPDAKHIRGQNNEHLPTCEECDRSWQVSRPRRKEKSFEFHRSTILSGDRVQMDARDRDAFSRKYHNAKCFEMEGASVMKDIQGLVIRGISDYSDSHKWSYTKWRKYAAGTAAAFAREFLSNIRPETISEMPSKGIDVQAIVSQSSSDYDDKSISENFRHNQHLLEDRRPESGLSEAPDDETASSFAGDVSTFRNEEDRRQFINYYDRGQHIYRTRNSLTKNDTRPRREAISVFLQARIHLLASPNTGPLPRLKVAFHLFRLSQELTFTKPTPVKLKEYIYAAEQYLQEMLEATRKIHDPGVVAQMDLEQATMKATRLMNTLGGGTAEAIAIAKRRIETAAGELKRVDAKRAERSLRNVNWWIKHLQDYSKALHG